jgi:hypothetical protein
MTQVRSMRTDARGDRRLGWRQRLADWRDVIRRFSLLVQVWSAPPRTSLCRQFDTGIPMLDRHREKRHYWAQIMA